MHEMLNLLFAQLLPSKQMADDQDEGFIGKLMLWGRRQGQYRRALAELRQLDDGELDDLGIGRGDFSELAWHHVNGGQPLVRPYR
jgi:uncharacterized protein YjiS (DUF1127 family)